MNGKAALLSVAFALVVLAVLCRFRSPIIARWDPPQDASLGRAGESPHKERMLGFAMHDMMFSIVFAFCLASISRGPFTFWFILVLLLGEIMHAIFGIRSATFRWLFEGEVQPALDVRVASVLVSLGLASGLAVAIFAPGS